MHKNSSDISFSISFLTVGCITKIAIAISVRDSLLLLLLLRYLCNVLGHNLCLTALFVEFHTVINNYVRTPCVCSTDKNTATESQN